MNFKDQLNYNRWSILKTFWLRARMKRLYKQQIKSDLEQLDFMQKTISETENQIYEWETLTQNESFFHIQEDIKRDIEVAKAYNAYLKIECFIVLLELDLYVAIKHLFIATDDWEDRFFARRCFTLIYELKQSLEKDSLNNNLKILREIIDSEIFKEYIFSKKEILNYIKPYSAFFKEIRNAGEAHKDINFTRQIDALESISIRESYGLIFKFFQLMLDLSKKSLLISKNLYVLYNKELKYELIGLSDTNT